MIEVMVALAIISIALLAAMRAASQGTSSVNELRMRLLANFIAQNHLALHRAKNEWIPLGIERGNEKQGGISFVWREEVLATPNANFRRVNISIFPIDDNNRSIAQLTGFLVKKD